VDVTSQEQSWSGTPAGATTLSLSPLCSVPPSPKFRDVLSSAYASSFFASERDQELREERCGHVGAGDGRVGRGGEGADGGPEGGGAGVVSRAQRGWGFGQHRSCGVPWCVKPEGHVGQITS
jgi:hypothetical protein